MVQLKEKLKGSCIALEAAGSVKLVRRERRDVLTWSVHLTKVGAAEDEEEAL